MQYTRDDVDQWVKANWDELERDRLSYEDEGIQMLNRVAPALSQRLWAAGCWLKERLLEHGATDQVADDACFAAGQRSVAADPYDVAIKYANEFIALGRTQEKGGPDLAEKINDEMFGTDK